MTKNTILFVDDEPQILFSLAGTFEAEHNVLMAESGPQAIELLKKYEVQVIVCDQRMPEMLGHEVLRMAKTISPATTRILLTGYSDLDAVMDSVNSGEVFRYINKPWNTERLRETIQLACSISRKIQAVKSTHQVTFHPNASLQANEAASEVLFIDTNANHLQSLKNLFASEYRVHTASTAEQAYNVLRNNSVSVVATDVKLGETDGVDFLAAVNDDFPDVVSILLSDSKDASIAIRLINEGRVFRYLVKPFQRELIKNTIKLAVSQHQGYKQRQLPNIKAFETADMAEPKTNGMKQLSDALSLARQKLKNRSTY
ncbi:MAG: response regulator [Rhizobacter sp.]|nr:response regulator [Chlorobiales bacterium]